MEKAIIVIDSTALNLVQFCERKYDLVVNGARKPVEVPNYLEEGDLMHWMLKYYYILRRSRTRWVQNNRTHDDVVASCVKIGQHHAIKLQLHPDEVGETIFQFREYCKFYEHDGWDRIVAVEQVGSFILYEDDKICIVYELKPDLVVQLTNVSALPVDHKTAKQRREHSGLSNQFMSYCYAINCNALTVNKIGFQKTLPPKERFQRQTISYPQDVLEEWRENTIDWVKRILHNRDRDYWPANFTSCDKYGGCVFRHVCIKERIAREVALARDFIVDETWDVGRGL